MISFINFVSIKCKKRNVDVVYHSYQEMTHGKFIILIFSP